MATFEAVLEYNYIMYDIWKYLDLFAVERRVVSEQKKKNKSTCSATQPHCYVANILNAAPIDCRHITTYNVFKRLCIPSLDGEG